MLDGFTNDSSLSATHPGVPSTEYFDVDLLAVAVFVHPLEEVDGVLVMVTDRQEPKDVVEVPQGRKEGARGQVPQPLEVPDSEDGSKLLVGRYPEKFSTETLKVRKKPSRRRADVANRY